MAGRIKEQHGGPGLTPQRQAVLFRYYEGRAVEEIGERLGRTRAGVASLLRRGLDRLRRDLAAGGES